MKFAFIIGTRPEAIKLAPLILLMHNNKINYYIISTGQHKEMLAQVFRWFEIQPHFELSIMTDNQSLNSVTSKILSKLDTVLEEIMPDCIITQGDTTTAFAASLAAFYRKIKVAHIEAGLRTWNKYSPWPEEMNRVLISKIADFHFAPTQWSYTNLLNENIDKDSIVLTGNTVVDALFYTKNKLKSFNHYSSDLSFILKRIQTEQKFVLITGHRRENWGEGFENICDSIKELATRHTDVVFIYPVHLNPNVKNIVYSKLSNIHNIILTEPLSYPEFVLLMHKSYLIMTDSGGVQEEAPSFGKPVVLMRDTTERPEGVEAGNVLMVGSDMNDIVRTVSELITNTDSYAKMSRLNNPYGDGKASERILAVLQEKLKQP